MERGATFHIRNLWSVDTVWEAAVGEEATLTEVL